MLRTESSPDPAPVETAARGPLTTVATTVLTGTAATAATTVTPDLTKDTVGVRHHKSRHDVGQQQVSFENHDPKPTDPKPTEPTPVFQPDLDGLGWDSGATDMAAVIQAVNDANAKAVFDVLDASIAAQQKHLAKSKQRHAKQDPIDKANAAALAQQRQRQAQTQAAVVQTIADQQAAKRKI